MGVLGFEDFLVLLQSFLVLKVIVHVHCFFVLFLRSNGLQVKVFWGQENFLLLHNLLVPGELKLDLFLVVSE